MTYNEQRISELTQPTAQLPTEQVLHKYNRVLTSPGKIPDASGEFDLKVSKGLKFLGERGLLGSHLA